MGVLEDRQDEDSKPIPCETKEAQDTAIPSLELSARQNLPRGYRNIKITTRAFSSQSICTLATRHRHARFSYTSASEYARQTDIYVRKAHMKMVMRHLLRDRDLVPHCSIRNHVLIDTTRHGVVTFTLRRAKVRKVREERLL